MGVEYDLIVIGNSPESVYAASAAACLKARVALIQQETPSFDHLTASTLTHFTRLSKQLGEIQLSQPQIPLGAVRSISSEIASTLQELDSPAILASLGIDVLTGAAEFGSKPSLSLTVNKRRLRSRTYLIATSSHLQIPHIQGLADAGYLTTADLSAEDNLVSLPESLVLVGGSPRSIELAQSFARLGKDVTLVVEDNRILPQEDPEASMLVQAQLEADGASILTESTVTQVRRIEDKKWVQAGNNAIEVDEILIEGERSPNVEGLNLEGVGVEYKTRGIQVNEKLQTTNPRIYACGDVTGGYSFTHIAEYEAGIALKNALFLPIFKVNYRAIPWAILTEPNLARVGMTEAQARQRYGKDFYVARQYFKTIVKAQVWGETTGFCKLLVRGNGEIIGAHIVGHESAELIGAIALAMKNKIKLGRNILFGSLSHDLPYVSFTFSEIIQQCATQWQRQRLSRNKKLLNFLESLFYWRRS